MNDLQNDQSAIQYRLRAEQMAKRLAEFTKDPAIDSLQREIGVLRLLLEEQLNAGKVSAGSVSTLITTMDRLIARLDERRFRSGELLAKSSIVRLADSLVRLVMEAFEGVDRFDERVDQIAQRIPEAIALAKNDDV